MPEPAVGRAVHYVSYGTPGGEYAQACRAATITAVQGRPHDPQVSLCVLNPTGLFFNQLVAHDEGQDAPPVPVTALEPEAVPLCGGRHYPGGTWHWPERKGD